MNAWWRIAGAASIAGASVARTIGASCGMATRPEGGRRYPDPEESFLARTERRGDCLIWTGALVRGYGMLNVGGTNDYAHRYAWERAFGPLADGAKVDHQFHCDTACCEINHLRQATAAENGWNRNGPSRNSTTGIRHVSIHQGRPRVQIRRGERYHHSTHESIEEAAAVAERITQEWDGEFAGPIRARGD